MRTQLMRAPSPRSGLTVTPRPGWGVAGGADAKRHRALNVGRGMPPDGPPDCALVSPASSTSSLENVWSPKHPEVTASEMRSACGPNAVANGELEATAAS